MATSVVRSNENQHTTNTNTNTNTSLHHLSEDYNCPIRRSSSGRKKAKGGEQKIRRRGMGVEKLERLRIQEKLKQQMSNNNPALIPFAPTFQFPMSGQNPGHLGQMGQSNFHGVDQFHSTYDQLISSNPNAALNCTLSQNCNTCHKKKRVLGENPGCSKVRKDVYNYMQMSPFGEKLSTNGENHFLTTKPPLVPQGHVEVVAVHKKGSSSNKGSGVLMEYEFIPDGRSKKAEEGSFNNDHDLMMRGLGTTTNTSAQTSATGFDASTCIDLSLKLSF